MEYENPVEYPFTDWEYQHHLFVYYQNYTPGIYPVETRVKLFKPCGFNVTIPAKNYPRMVVCDFDGDVNKPIVNHTFYEAEGAYNICGGFTYDTVNDLYWEFLDFNTELKVGDILYYWLTVILEPPMNESYRIVAIKTRNEYAELITDAHMINRKRIK